MHPDELLDSLRAESSSLIEALRGDLSTDVPSCPGWTLETLVNHCGRIHRWATANVRAKTDEGTPFPGRPPAIDVEWFEEGVTELLAAFEEADPDDKAWNFLGQPPTVRVWLRRQAHETAVHRWDAQNARTPGDAAPVETELALDGIDELFDVVLARAYKGDDLGGMVHLHATDSPHGEWLIRTVDGELLVGHDHQKGDVAVRGTASDLLLWLWGRVPLDAEGLEVFGDEKLAHRVREVLQAP